MQQFLTLFCRSSSWARNNEKLSQQKHENHRLPLKLSRKMEFLEEYFYEKQRPTRAMSTADENGTEGELEYNTISSHSSCYCCINLMKTIRSIYFKVS